DASTCFSFAPADPSARCSRWWSYTQGQKPWASLLCGGDQSSYWRGRRASCWLRAACNAKAVIRRPVRLCRHMFDTSAESLGSSLPWRYWKTLKEKHAKLLLLGWIL
ncbi:unnamed protein product, partial [Laminaria digitata]